MKNVNLFAVFSFDFIAFSETHKTSAKCGDSWSLKCVHTYAHMFARAHVFLSACAFVNILKDSFRLRCQACLFIYILSLMFLLHIIIKLR